LSGIIFGAIGLAIVSSGLSFGGGYPSALAIELASV
jgi:hypothetical protein